MLKRVVAVGICILAVMIAIKDGRVLRSSGLTGSCTAVQTRADGSELEACRGGKLEGRPDLSHRGCISFGLSAELHERTKRSVLGGPPASRFSRIIW